MDLSLSDTNDTHHDLRLDLTVAGQAIGGDVPEGAAELRRGVQHHSAFGLLRPRRLLRDTLQNLLHLSTLNVKFPQAGSNTASSGVTRQTPDLGHFEGGPLFGLPQAPRASQGDLQLAVRLHLLVVYRQLHIQQVGLYLLNTITKTKA